MASQMLKTELTNDQRVRLGVFEEIIDRAKGDFTVDELMMLSEWGADFILGGRPVERMVGEDSPISEESPQIDEKQTVAASIQMDVKNPSKIADFLEKTFEGPAPTAAPAAAPILSPPPPAPALSQVVSFSSAAGTGAVQLLDHEKAIIAFAKQAKTLVAAADLPDLPGISRKSYGTYLSRLTILGCLRRVEYGRYEWRSDVPVSAEADVQKEPAKSSPPFPVPAPAPTAAPKPIIVPPPFVNGVDPLQHVMDWLLEHEDRDVKRSGNRYSIDGRISVSPEELVQVANRRRRAAKLPEFSYEPNVF